MLKSESIFIGIILSIIITECFNYYIFDSKVLSSLAYILVFVVAYEKLTYRGKKHVIEKYTNNDIKKVEFEEFIPSNTFTGRKPGYVFKTDNNGTGYYLD